MKQAAKYLLILSLLGMGTSALYAQEADKVVYSETVADTVTTNKAQISLTNQSVMVNEKPLSKTVEVREVEGTYFVEARFVAETLLSAYVSLEDSQTLRIKRQDTLVIIKSHESVAEVNGESVQLQHELLNEEGRYMLSLEDLKLLFDVQSDYDAEGQVLKLTGEDRRPNEKPEARFYFMKKSYVEGQEVVAVNISNDKDQDEIVAVKWSVGENEAVTSDTLSKIFSKPKAGTYKIGLQVQDARGLWSDWAYETIQITENKPPVITSLTTQKATYAPGEEIIFDYTYENEEGEAITNEKWMYRQSTQEERLAVLGKPNAFFTAGDYIVTLQIDDAYGKRSEKIETTVHVEGTPVKSEFEHFFNEGQIGDRIDNFGNYNYRDYKEAEVVEESQTAGTLIMSDSPETVKALGVLYEDTMEGSGRVLIHHLNQVSSELTGGKKQKLAIVISNDQDEPVTLNLSNEAIKGPATDITRVGQKVVYDYLTGSETRSITLQPGEKQWLYLQTWTPNNCISGMFDVETAGKVRFIVAAITEDVTLEQVDDLERLPADGVHISGTFDTVALNYTLDLQGDEPTKLLLGDKGNEEWVKGVDVRTGEATFNKGNFGVSYNVTITAHEDMGIFLNSRGGGLQGAIKWDDGSVYNVPTQGILAQVSTRAAVIGTIKKGETKTFEYILPNGSSAPVLIGFVPTSFF